MVKGDLQFFCFRLREAVDCLNFGSWFGFSIRNLAQKRDAYDMFPRVSLWVIIDSNKAFL
jgi:hypothetical protein